MRSLWVGKTHRCSPLMRGCSVGFDERWLGMAEERKVYKTVVTVDIGFSIQDSAGNWEKSNVSVGTESGPGYPTEQEMRHIIEVQMGDAVAGCDKIIDALVAEIKKRG